MSKLRVLVACEFSGIVRDAFIARGHDAMSCDFLPTERPGPHYQGDVDAVMYDDWDMIIAHPPCTRLVPRAVYWSNLRGTHSMIEDAVKFFMKFANSPCQRVAIENPVGIMSTRYRKPNQIINPYQFGHPQRKRTCLWLKGLPNLHSTNEVEPEKPAFADSKQARYWIDALPPSPDRWMIRSRTFQGIADAMADQWGAL